MTDVAAKKPWPLWRRRLVSGLLLFHLLGVISAPLAGPEPVSGLSKAVAYPFRWYVRAAYLKHGYRYFNVVGSTSIVRYELTMPDGSRRRERLADRFRDWPRLLYHRHLMLGETVFRAAEIVSPEDFQAAMAQTRQTMAALRREGFSRLAAQAGREIEWNEREYRAARSRRDELLQAVAQHLMRQHGAVRLRLYVQAQRIPGPEEVEMGTRLGDDSLYAEKLVGEFGREP